MLTFQVYRKSDQDDEYISSKKNSKSSKSNNYSLPPANHIEPSQTEQVCDFACLFLVVRRNISAEKA